jgi:hypothetical protein
MCPYVVSLVYTKICKTNQFDYKYEKIILAIRNCLKFLKLEGLKEYPP